jgi:hypothetical protein
VVDRELGWEFRENSFAFPEFLRRGLSGLFMFPPCKDPLRADRSCSLDSAMRRNISDGRQKDGAQGTGDLLITNL